MHTIEAQWPTPLTWRELASAIEAFETGQMVNQSLELAFGLHATRGWCVNCTVVATPSVFSPWYGKRVRCVVTKQQYLGAGFNLPQLIWRTYWECDQKVGLLWPIAQVVD